MIIKLRLTNSKAAGTVFPVWKSPFLIGRHADADVRVGNGMVSVHHCLVILKNNEVWVKDLGSSNGTFVNDERVSEERRLRMGDRLGVGPAVFEILQESTGMLRLDDKADYESTALALGAHSPAKHPVPPRPTTKRGLT